MTDPRPLPNEPPPLPSRRILPGWAIGLLAAVLGLMTAGGIVIAVRTGQVLGRARSAKHELTCQNNLRMIGGILLQMKKSGRLRFHAGPRFLLQTIPEISDSDLSMFICPAEPEDPKHPRPKPGTREFVRMYRDLDLSWDVDLSRYTSYAGPDWAHWNAKQPGDARKMDLWACDRCRDARFHHERGIAVLFADTARVELLRPGDVPGLEEDRGILIGADSPVDLFRRMTFAGSAVHR